MCYCCCTIDLRRLAGGPCGRALVIRRRHPRLCRSDAPHLGRRPPTNRRRHRTAHARGNVRGIYVSSHARPAVPLDPAVADHTQCHDCVLRPGVRDGGRDSTQRCAVRPRLRRRMALRLLRFRYDRLRLVACLVCTLSQLAEHTSAHIGRRTRIPARAHR